MREKESVANEMKKKSISEDKRIEGQDVSKEKSRDEKVKTGRKMSDQKEKSAMEEKKKVGQGSFNEGQSVIGSIFTSLEKWECTKSVVSTKESKGKTKESECLIGNHESLKEQENKEKQDKIENVGNLKVNPFTYEQALDVAQVLKCSSPCAYLEKQLLDSVHRISLCYHVLKFLRDNLFFDHIIASFLSACAFMHGARFIYSLDVLLKVVMLRELVGYLFVYVMFFMLSLKGKFLAKNVYALESIVVHTSLILQCVNRVLKIYLSRIHEGTSRSVENPGMWELQLLTRSLMGLGLTQDLVQVRMCARLCMGGETMGFAQT
ncbi:hypothetical protein M9H77_03754 [Catharanthus roseus]|uniref:Uncharacterized protein n=1 Tax=Catharanthus roseus TaxID=4058 RepID=A0ACC0CCL4_CATRO|nr:hypothetical protein M9H77_03754 [Catharanthus roseus]